MKLYVFRAKGVYRREGKAGLEGGGGRYEDAQVRVFGEVAPTVA